MNILGIQLGHDSSACILNGNEIIAASPEERFSRVKNDSSFPLKAIDFCLKEANLSSEQVDVIAIPQSNLTRHHECFLNLDIVRERNSKISFKNKIKRKLRDIFIKQLIPKGTELPIYYKRPFFKENTKIHCCHHHKAHAASAYYTSGFKDEKVLIVTMDGVGEGISSALWLGSKNKLQKVKSYGTESSIGFFYGNATESLGWRISSDEWKLMGLAPYGTPKKIDLNNFHPHFKNGELYKPYKFKKITTLYEGQSQHFHSSESYELKNLRRFISQEDFAAEVQRVAEEQALKFIIPNLKKQKTKTLAVAGGCFMNIKLNALLRDNKDVKKFWVYPDSGDAGLAIGAALDAYYSIEKKEKQKSIKKLEHFYYGPSYSNDVIKETLDQKEIKYKYFKNIELEVAKYLNDNLTIGWFQGRMEIGPRALGNRSILMSPIKAENKDIINAKIKYRESFRPFCPSIHIDKADEWIDNSKDEMFMASSFKANKKNKTKIPAVVHVDGTLRPQLVSKEINPRYYNLIEEFYKLTNVPILLNTSFNVKGEPIVCTPVDAIRCFYSSGIDILVLNNFVIYKNQ